MQLKRVRISSQINDRTIPTKQASTSRRGLDALIRGTQGPYTSNMAFNLTYKTVTPSVSNNLKSIKNQLQVDAKMSLNTTKRSILVPNSNRTNFASRLSRQIQFNLP